MSKPIDQELPCPFCGGCKTEVCHDEGISWTRCKTCGATGPALSKYSGEEGEPCTDWNSRAAVQPAGVAVPDAVLVGREWLCELQKYVSSFEKQDELRAMLAAAPHPVSGEQKPVHWRAVLHADQRPQQLHDKHVVGFTTKEAAEAWVSEKKDFQGWDYSVEPLYKGPPAAQDVAGLVEALRNIEQTSSSTRLRRVAREALSAHRAQQGEQP